MPDWAREQKEFWDAIRRRNLWTIRLRYGVVVVLVFILIILNINSENKFTTTQLISWIAISSILVYNLILHYLRRYVKLDVNKFNPLYISLTQMILDLISLLLLVYFTGGIESPLYMLFVFHMIVGSLILPGAVVYTLATIFVALFILINYS